MSALILACAFPALAGPPARAPGRYATYNYGLTFRVPAGTSYCPLPRDWVGSDHGTTIFLERPRNCAGGAGYPSISRGPEEGARIWIYYAYWMGEDERPPPPCRRVGRLQFLGRDRPVCETGIAGFVRREVRARYTADIAAEASFTLVTRPSRLDRDMPAFAMLVRSARTCSAVWRTPGRRPFILGVGARCPPVGTF